MTCAYNDDVEPNIVLFLFGSCDSMHSSDKDCSIEPPSHTIDNITTFGENTEN